MKFSCPPNPNIKVERGPGNDADDLMIKHGGNAQEINRDLDTNYHPIAAAQIRSVLSMEYLRARRQRKESELAARRRSR